MEELEEIFSDNSIEVMGVPMAAYDQLDVRHERGHARVFFTQGKQVVVLDVDVQLHEIVLKPVL